MHTQKRTHTHTCTEPTSIDAIAHNGPTLSRACLTIGKKCRIVALPCILQNPSTKVIVYTFLEVEVVEVMHQALVIINYLKKRLKKLEGPA